MAQDLATQHPGAPGAVTSGAAVPPPRTAPGRPRTTYPSLVVTPAVVAHRGASGYRPEHTLAAYRTAIRMGVDDIELDLVPTRDGVLVARHESEISGTTDIAHHPELADRRTTKVVDGVEQTGWFVEDLTLAELKTLGARERMPHTRPDNTAHDGVEGIATFNEILAMVAAEGVRRGRAVGVMAELKSAAHFARLGLPLDVPLLADLARHGQDHARSRVSVMSFEPTVLKQIARRSRIPVVQLLDRPDRRPADYAAVGNGMTFGDLASPAGLAGIEAYADGVGAHKDLVLPPDADGCLGLPTRLVRDAHRRWLTVHVWTLRAENRFLPVDLRNDEDPDARGNLEAEVDAFLDAGVDGLITDHPDVALLRRAARG